MAESQSCRLHHVVGLTWLMLAMSDVQICHSFTIDQIITRAMKKSPGADGLLYDAQHRTVRVGLDMVYTVDHWAKLLQMSSSNGEGRYRRQAIRESAWRSYWPNGIIYYEIHRAHFSRRDIRRLHSAMDEWMRHTCVQFRPAPPHARNKIVFMDGDGCASSVGMIGRPQALTLSKGCRVKGVVIHELGHVLGFNHEQTRPDRDQYVTVGWYNIPGKLHYNFRKYSWAMIRDLGVPYDYLSIMHYGKDAFSGNGGITMVTRDPRYQEMIGNRRGLSFRDIKSANILYNCTPSSDRCSLRDDDCPGEGFVSKNCTCWCPTEDIYIHIHVPYYVCDPNSASNQHRGGWQHGSRTEGVWDHANTHVTAATSSGECEDQNKNCEMWAGRGECRDNPEYMHTSCRTACGLCDTVETACRDDFESCAFWRERGFCGSPSSSSSSPLKSFITSKCRKTCGVCKTVPGGRKGGQTLGCDGQCEDQDDQCQEWADRGECSTTPDYMLRYCRKACHACCT